jgi:hypothetical protein
MDNFIGEQDFFFALAPWVLKDEAYSNFFLQRPTVMDNGVHETGEPLPAELLLEAASLIEPMAIIPPDYLYDWHRTYEGFQDMAAMVPVEKLWPVVQGRSIDELMLLAEQYAVHRVTKVCLPYRLRAGIRNDLAMRLKTFGLEIHFLSLTRLEELYFMRMVPNASFDTGKPFRWAQQGMVWGEDMAERAPHKLHMLKDFNPNLAKRSIQVIREIVNFER